MRSAQLLASPRRRARRPRLIEAGIERLEDRCLLSAAGGGAVMVFSVGGTAGDDLPDVGHVDASDLIAYDGNQFSLLFDGSDVDLSGADIDAVAVMSENQILLSFASTFTIAGLGPVGSSDVILFQADSLGENTAGTFSVLVTGADLGLAGPAGNIDALDVLDDGSLVFSTAGFVYLPVGPDGAMAFVPEADVVQYTPSLPNDYSDGTMQLFFDASDANLSFPSEDIDGFSVNGSQVQLSTVGGFFIDSQGLSGDQHDVLTYQVASLGEDTTGSYVGITFDGSVLFGHTVILNALDYFDFPQTTNQPPTAQNLTADVAEDGSVPIQLLGDDGEPDIEQPLTYVIVRGLLTGRSRPLIPPRACSPITPASTITEPIRSRISSRKPMRTGW